MRLRLRCMHPRCMRRRMRHCWSGCWRLNQRCRCRGGHAYLRICRRACLGRLPCRVARRLRRPHRRGADAIVASPANVAHQGMGAQLSPRGMVMLVAAHPGFGRGCTVGIAAQNLSCRLRGSTGLGADAGCANPIQDKAGSWMRCSVLRVLPRGRRDVRILWPSCGRGGTE